MGFNFPNAPTVGQLYPTPAIAGAPVWKWNGSVWIAVGGQGLGGIYVSDTAPVGAPDGALWWESTTGVLYLRYNDGDSSQWTMAMPVSDASLYAVRFDLAQALTALQQTQARGNIGVNPAIAIARVQTFGTTGTYIPNANMIYSMIECQGAGGGGGCGQSISGWVTGGGGGGSGAFARSFLTKAQIGVSQAITIGAGGASGNPGNGGTGGTTSVGALMSASGGNGGGASSGGSGGAGGTGGGTAAGDIIVAGKYGFCGGGAPSTQGSFGGHGADSMYGLGALGQFNSAATNATSGTLGGGGAGGIAFNAVAGAGGLGGNGLVYVTEYCSA